MARPYIKIQNGLCEKLVSIIQSAITMPDEKKKALDDLHYNIQPMIYKLFPRFKWVFQSVEDLSGFVYINLEDIASRYKMGIGHFIPFFERNLRALIQQYINYNHDLVHVPVMKKEKFELTITNDDNILNSIEDKQITDPMGILDYLDAYEKSLVLPKSKENYEIYKVYKTDGEFNYRKTGEIVKISHQTVKNKLEMFYADFKRFVNHQKSI